MLRHSRTACVVVAAFAQYCWVHEYHHNCLPWFSINCIISCLMYWQAVVDRTPTVWWVCHPSVSNTIRVRCSRILMLSFRVIQKREKSHLISHSKESKRKAPGLIHVQNVLKWAMGNSAVPQAGELIYVLFTQEIITKVTSGQHGMWAT